MVYPLLVLSVFGDQYPPFIGNIIVIVIRVIVIRGGHHCSVDLVGVSPARDGWKDAPPTLSAVEQGKRDKHATVCHSCGFDFIPFSFSVFGSFGPEAQVLLHRVVKRYRLHAQVADSRLDPP